jgi:hypothetical protein
MSPLDALPRLYEDLANHYARQGEARQRDNCLVLAAAAALSVDLPAEAERLRKRLLLTNPHHMLRPYGSMAEAMQSGDVRDYVDALRKALPPTTVEKLLNRSGETYGMAEPAPLAKPVQTAKPKARAAPVAEEASGLSYALSLLAFGLGLTIAGAVLFAVFVAPLLD